MGRGWFSLIAEGLIDTVPLQHREEKSEKNLPLQKNPPVSENIRDESKTTLTSHILPSAEQVQCL